MLVPRVAQQQNPLGFVAFLDFLAVLDAVSVTWYDASGVAAVFCERPVVAAVCASAHCKAHAIEVMEAIEVVPLRWCH